MDKFPNWADHIVIFIFCVLVPLLAIRQYQKNTSPAVYSSRQKHVFYFSTCITLFVMAAIVMAVWLSFKRPRAEIGLTLRIEGSLWLWTTLAFILLYAIDTIYSVATSKNLTASRSDWEKRTPFMPTTMKEFPAYLVMCLCAGIFEEIVYRGYLVTYFMYLFNDAAYQQVLAVFVSAFVFSISHFYHGVKNIVKIFVLSGFLGYIFIQSQSLIIVMVLHFIINVIGGLLTVKYAGKKLNITNGFQ